MHRCVSSQTFYSKSVVLFLDRVSQRTFSVANPTYCNVVHLFYVLQVYYVLFTLDISLFVQYWYIFLAMQIHQVDRQPSSSRNTPYSILYGFFRFLLTLSAHMDIDILTCVCVCVFFPFILVIKFVGRTSRGHTGGRSHRVSHPPSFCGACLHFSREKDSAIPFPRRP